MKKYLIKIAVFFVTVAFLDFFFGKVCDYLRDNTKGGFSGNIHYICQQCDEDIIMMGSSRMRHHYVPEVFEDSLGLTCYNAGIDGNGIIMNYGFLEMILQRYIPKLIIYDIAGFDMYKDDNTKYLVNLRPYYNTEGIHDIFVDVDKNEKWKMLSNLYRYNSSLLGLLGDNIHPLQSFNKGYWPSQKVMEYEPELPDYNQIREIDPLKIAYLNKFIALTRKYKVPLVFTASPTWYGDVLIDDNIPAKETCAKADIPFIDNYFDNELSSDKRYWSDATHLNDMGARIFSKTMVSKLNFLLARKCR